LQERTIDLGNEVLGLKQSHEKDAGQLATDLGKLQTESAEQKEELKLSKTTIADLRNEVAGLKEVHRAGSDILTAALRRHEEEIAAQLNCLRDSVPLNEAVYMQPGHLSGIISYLSSRCNGNVHDCGIVNITSSGICNTGRVGKYAADLNPYTSFASADSPDSWLKYDFKVRRIRPTYYTLLTYSAGVGSGHPRHWKLKGVMMTQPGMYSTPENRTVI
jgi:hypothetical protein